MFNLLMLKVCKRVVLILQLLLLFTFAQKTMAKNFADKEYAYAVVGAGPAGIITVGGLLDRGIKPEDIVWLDNEFIVGRFGKFYRQIQSNTLVKGFIDYLQRVKSFNVEQYDDFKKMRAMNPFGECLLDYVANILQNITNDFRKKVASIQDDVIKLSCSRKKQEQNEDELFFDLDIFGIDDEQVSWIVHTKKEQIKAKKVILAIGCEPRKLDCGVDSSVVSLETAYNINTLKEFIEPNDVVAVFGNSHSGILVIKHLLALEKPPRQIINFYRSEICYQEGNEFYEYNVAEGISGELAAWAKEHIDRNPPLSLIKVFNTDENRENFKHIITKTIFSVGYERVDIPIDSDGLPVRFDDRSSRISKNLFGIGFAYPKGTINSKGNYKRFVEIKHFILRMEECIDQWLQD